MSCRMLLCRQLDNRDDGGGHRWNHNHHPHYCDHHLCLQACQVKAKFHYASRFGAGPNMFGASSELVQSYFGAGSKLKFGLSLDLLAAN